MGCSDHYNYFRKPAAEGLKTARLRQTGIHPGPCYHHGCPPPTEIVCINVEKVYEECKRVQVNEEIVDLSGVAVGDIQQVFCKEPELVIDKHHSYICEKLPGSNRARVSFYFRFRFDYQDQEGFKCFTSEPVFHQAIVIMSERICDKRIIVQCHVYLECIDCFASNLQQVTCCIGKLIVFKLVAPVQLMIPAYGFCPEPEDCTQVEAECPEYFPEWPPYPPQPEFPSFEDDNGNNGNNGGNAGNGEET